MNFISRSLPRKGFFLLLLAFAAGSAHALSAPANQLDYDARTAAEKQQSLLDQIDASEYQTLPQWTGKEALGLFGMAINPIRSVVRNHLNVTMERNSDVMPDGRKKAIHTYGSTVGIAFIADGNTSYTGLYKGVDYGLARLSLAKKPDPTNTTPGIAVKFMIDGKPSANFVAMYSLDGQEGYDFFAQGFKTQINPPLKANVALKILAAAFETVSKNPTKVDVAYMASINQDGSTVSNPIAPEILVLFPNQSLHFDRSEHEVRDDFATIAPGTTLYEVYGGKRDMSSDRNYIGRIVTTTRFVASQFGDQKLFFRHQRFNNK